MALNLNALQVASYFDHPVAHFELLETHISWVLLTGDFAYKIKKPVNLGFVDYTSLDKRKQFCEEELRLNQRLAKDLYLAVVPIFGTLEEPSFKKVTSEPIEYAVKMRQFDQSRLLSRLIQKDQVTGNMLANIASQIALFHENAERTVNSFFGSAESIEEPMLDNFSDCEILLSALETPSKFSSKTAREISPETLSNEIQLLNSLRTWSEESFKQKLNLLESRKRRGFIRDCHGDLHLGNMVEMNSEIVIFDCIEFNPDFRWIDIMNEIAFLVMDLEERKHPALGFHFLNYYLQQIGDYEGLELLDFYKVYRAMVRAKVALESPIPNKLAVFNHYLQYASNIAKISATASKQKKQQLIITFGVSGSGKTFISNKEASRVPAIHIRSDVERKRLFRAVSLSDLYTEEKTEATYERLYEIATALLQWGYSVVVDATFLQKAQRHRFHRLAENLRIPFRIWQFSASKEVLSERIARRLKTNRDASDATLDVLELQLKNVEELSMEELEWTEKIDGPTDNSLG